MTWRALLTRCFCLSATLRQRLRRFAVAFARRTPIGWRKPVPAERLEVARSLLDVRSYAASRNAIIQCSTDLQQLIRSMGAVSDLDDRWAQSASNPHPYIATLPNVTLLPGSKVLLAANGHALSDEMEMAFRKFALRPKIWAMRLSEGPVLHFTPAPASRQVIPAGIHLTGEHEANYFHWLCEILPRLFLYEKATSETALPLLVSDGLHPNLYSLIDKVSSSRRTMIRLDPTLRHRVKRLTYPSDVHMILDVYDRAPGQDTTFFSVPLLRQMAAKIKDATAPLGRPQAGTSNRLFVRRQSSYRKLVNALEVEALLVARGFCPVDPGELDVQDQIELFSRARQIIAPSGAALANLLWCQPGAKVLVLHADHPFKKYPYWDAVARAAEIDISYVCGPRAHHVEGHFQAHDDFRMGLEDLDVAMKRMNFC